MGKAGIHEVAKLAGVSISTVSRAFTRPELVSEKTRQKVLAAADKLDFNISRSATALKSGQTYRVALLMNEDVTSWFNNQVLSGLDSVLHPAGYDISLYQHIDTAENRREFFTNLPVRRNVDAVVVCSFSIEPQEVEQLKRVHVPIVGINNPSAECFDASISINDEDGMYRATQHLINLKHRNIVYVCSEPAATMNASIDARTRGFTRACENAQTKHDDFAWQILTVTRGKEFIDAALAGLLALEEFPDAICCQMDMLAIPLILKLARYGYHTPDNYSIIGFDDTPYADTLNLTTMRQNPYDMGRKAANKALALIEDQPLENPHEIIDTQLILRDSDAPYIASEK